MENYMDKKWRLSKEDACSHSYNSSKPSSLLRSLSTKTSKSPLLRSFSHKSSSSSSSSSYNSTAKSSLSRSSSQKTKSPSLSRSSSHKCSNFTRKCSSLAKEQKAKFYIVKRCITMLVCWKKHGDS